MKKISIFFVVWFLVFGFLSYAFAGGIDNLQNFSARYSGTGSRNAALDGADIVAYNPAGIAWQEDGITIEVDIQYISKDFVHNYTQTHPSQDVTKDQNEPSIIPSMFVVYKKDKLGLFSSFTVIAGGGKVSYDNGNYVTDQIEQGFVALTGSTVAGNIENERIEAESQYLAFTTGGTYRFSDKFSTGAGIRFVQAEKKIDASANISNLLIGAGALNGQDYSDGLEGGYEQTDESFGFVLSANYAHSKDLLFALRYESKIELGFDTEITDTSTNLGKSTLASLGIEDGKKYSRDLPAVFGLGISYNASEKLNLNTSFTYYFQEQADWYAYDSATQTAFQLDSKVNNGFDLGLSATYSVNDRLRLSCGYMYTDTGFDAEDFDLQARMSPALNANTYLLGAGFDISEKSTINLSATTINYISDVDEARNVEYQKTNRALSFAYIYKF